MDYGEKPFDHLKCSSPFDLSAADEKAEHFLLRDTPTSHVT